MDEEVSWTQAEFMWVQPPPGVRRAKLGRFVWRGAHPPAFRQMAAEWKPAWRKSILFP